MSENEIEQLRDRISQLEDVIARLVVAPATRGAVEGDRAERPDAEDFSYVTTGETDDDPNGDSNGDVGSTSSRRGLLKLAAAAAGAAAVATTTTSAGTSHAADGDPLVAGAWVVAASPGEYDYTGSTASAGFLFQSGTILTPTSVDFVTFPSALVGSTNRAIQPIGVLGRTNVNPGTGVHGLALGSQGQGVRADGPTGVVANATSSTGHAVVATASGGYGVRGISTDSVGVVGNSTNDIGVFGAGATGVRGEGATAGLVGRGLGSGHGIEAEAAGAGNGVTATSSSGYAVQASTTTGSMAVVGSAPAGYGVMGIGFIGLVGHGATTLGTTGIGVQGSGPIGVSAVGQEYGAFVTVGSAGRSVLRLSGPSDRVMPPARTDAHEIGELDIDGSGDLWLCTASGTPGTWRKIAGPTSAGAFHALAPGRVYDSRVAAPGPAAALAAGQERTVSVRDRRSTVDGSVSLADFVPAGASAIAANVTVVNTVGAGFLTANPGGVHEINAATINWSATGQILNNGVILTLDANRELNVIAGGGAGAATDFVIDVTGYYR